MTNFSKQLSLCFTPDDERELSAAIKHAHPQVAFIDGVLFNAGMPVLSDSIDRCTSKNQVLIWNRDLFPELPTVRREDGLVVGPTIGPVIQYLRPIAGTNRLQCGRIAASASYEGPIMARAVSFAKDVFVITNKLSIRVRCIDPNGTTLNAKVHSFRAGHHAAKWVLETPNSFFTDASNNLYLPT